MSEASQMIEEEAHEDVNLIWGWIVDEDMGDEVRVTVIATDFQEGWQPSSAVPSSNQPPTTRPSPQPPAVVRQQVVYEVRDCLVEHRLQSQRWKLYPSILW